jgi:hypothetical protein
MASRIASMVALLGTLVTVAVGPGLTLVRCELTGDVMLECCCLEQAGGSDGSTAFSANDDCCTFQRLEAPWRSQALASAAQPHAQDVFPPLMSDFAQHGSGVALLLGPPSCAESSPNQTPLVLRI